MLNDYINISVGMLLIADRSFKVKLNRPSKCFTESATIKKGSVIEIRFQFSWNFRTECDVYCNAKPDVLIKNCSFYGKIHENIRFGNKHKLAEILTEGHYHKPDEFILTKKK